MDWRNGKLWKLWIYGRNWCYGIRWCYWFHGSIRIHWDTGPCRCDRTSRQHRTTGCCRIYGLYRSKRPDWSYWDSRIAGFYW